MDEITRESLGALVTDPSAHARTEPAGRFGLGIDVDELDLAMSTWDLVPCAIFVKDVDAKFVAANRNMLNRFGFDRAEDFVGLDDSHIHPADMAEVYREMDRHLIESGIPLRDVEDWQSGPDGSRFLVVTTKVPVRNRDGDIVGLVGVSTDVTEPTRVSAALADSEERYALAARATRDGIWDYDVRSGSITISPRCAEIFAVPVAEGPLQRALLRRRIGAEQFERMKTIVRRVKGTRGETLSLDFEFALDDGSTRCVNVVGIVVAKQDGSFRIVGSAADTTDERQRQAELRHQALHDDLTGLQNRRALVEALDDASGALLYLDLDSFKVVNDSLGHQAGDELLIALADRLTEVMEKGSALYRLGGDEFAIVLPEGNTAQALDLAWKINDGLRSPFDIEDLEIYTTASIGIISRLDDDRDPSDLLRDADIALYEAKASGKARAEVFEPSMRERAEEALQLQMHIRRAVEESEFELHYQPIVDARTGALTGLEALLRWRRPDGRCDAPSVFLPYLEESKLITNVGRWIFDAACAQMAAWQRDHPAMAETHLALNISRVQFDAPDLVHSISVAVDRHGLEPEHVVIEITETAVTERTPQLTSKLHELRALGFSVAIDDFGVGQSSLSALYDLPADILKIDRSFVERIAAANDEPVTRSVIAIARSLGMTTVAEGVETPTQLAWLTDHGCDRLQGYLLSRPVTVDAVPELHARLARLGTTA